MKGIVLVFTIPTHLVGLVKLWDTVIKN